MNSQPSDNKSLGADFVSVATRNSKEPIVKYKTYLIQHYFRDKYPKRSNGESGIDYGGCASIRNRVRLFAPVGRPFQISDIAFYSTIRSEVSRMELATLKRFGEVAVTVSWTLRNCSLVPLPLICTV
jgi:hypothetical protein